MTQTAASCNSEQFRCIAAPNECVPLAHKCDGTAHCADGSDEANCSTPSIRLVGSTLPNEGYVLVQRGSDKWGLVCDDHWDLNDAAVVCRQLGFSSAATALSGEQSTNRFNSTPSFPNTFLMDEVACQGSETSLAQCQFPGWGVHDCKAPKEAAGVVCTQTRGSGNEACLGNRFHCGNGRCVPFQWLCDGDNDCGNRNDENVDMCDATMSVRLLYNSTDKTGQLVENGLAGTSGLLQVRIYNVWGTVCDDQFDANDAKVACRMLGYPDSVMAAPVAAGTVGKVPVGQSGSAADGFLGPIWLDNLQCVGHEASLLECKLGQPGTSGLSAGRIGRHDCKHEEDVWLRCAHPRPIPQPSEGECGYRYVPELARDPRKGRFQRVVGGYDAAKDAFPWTAAILVHSTGAHHCGAALITDKHLLSAAHCFESDQLKPSDYEVVIGDWHNKVEEGSEQRFRLRGIRKFPRFKTLIEHDIVVLELGTPLNTSTSNVVHFTQSVQPVCLPPSDAQYTEGTRCIVSGWGSMGNRYPSVLQAAQVPIIPWAACAHKDVYGSLLSNTSFCAGYLQGGVDSCQGDSGGPLACEMDDGRYYLFGIISWGEGCAGTEKPGVYTRVKDYLEWIHGEVR